MRQRKFPARYWSAARVAPVLLALFALASSSLVPVSRARQQSGARPRRATTAAVQKAAAQTPTPTPAPQTQTQSQPTPTQTPAGQQKPKLQTQPVAEPDAPTQDGEQEVDPDELVTIDTN